MEYIIGFIFSCVAAVSVVVFSTVVLVEFFRGCNYTCGVRYGKKF